MIRPGRFIVLPLLVLLVLLSGCISTSSPVGMEEKYHDVSLTTKVYEAILDEPSLRPFDINVRTQKGIVELSGYVNSRDDMDKAIEVARRVSGIKAIKNDMQIRATGDY